MITFLCKSLIKLYQKEIKRIKVKKEGDKPARGRYVNQNERRHSLQRQRGLEAFPTRVNLLATKCEGAEATHGQGGALPVENKVKPKIPRTRASVGAPAWPGSLTPSRGKKVGKVNELR